jgi:hypothetical protein
MVKSCCLSEESRQQNAPIAQWIERYPPEVETCVRVAVGVHEPLRIDPERFLSLIRFDTRGKLVDLPDFQLDS